MSREKSLESLIKFHSRKPFYFPVSALYLTVRTCCALAFIVTVSTFSNFTLAQAGSSTPLVYDAGSSPSYHDPSFENTQTGVSAHKPMMPAGVLKLPPEENFLIWVELAEGRLNLLERQANGGFAVLKVMPISIGKQGFGKELEGDKRTPVGVYHFTSFLADKDLRDFYGLGAYPLNYPSPIDLRLNRTGSGIWLHGLPKGIEQRPFLDSDGCVIIDNASLLEMAKYIKTGLTHIVLTKDEINWQPMENIQVQSDVLMSAFDGWKQAWQAKDNNSYLAYYAEDFNSLYRNKVQWNTYKRRINNGKTSIEIDVSQLSFFADPVQEDVVTVRYYQDYQSNNYNWSGWKEQLWQKQDNQWQIIYEGNG